MHELSARRKDWLPPNSDLSTQMIWLRNMDCSMDGGIYTGMTRNLGFALIDMLFAFIDADDVDGAAWLIGKRHDFHALLAQHGRIFTFDSWIYFSEMGHGDSASLQSLHDLCLGGLEARAPSGFGPWLSDMAVRMSSAKQHEQLLATIPAPLITGPAHPQL